MKPLHYTTEKRIGDKKKINVEIRLSDDCKNGYCDFAITGTIYRKKSNGTWETALAGCIHEEILKYFPEFSDFVALHLSNSKGQPMYAVENGIYWLKDDLKKGADYLRISESVAMQLSADKDYFKYQLFALGIASGWKQDADKAIAHLEQLTGETFEDYENPKIVELSQEERANALQRQYQNRPPRLPPTPSGPPPSMREAFGNRPQKAPSPRELSAAG